MPKPARRKPEGVVHTSIYVPKPVYQKLREIAFTQERKVHDVIMEGIDAALRKYGHPGVAALEEVRKICRSSAKQMGGDPAAPKGTFGIASR